MAEGRKTTQEKIDAVAQGRVWTGHQALERGLVDEIGGLDRAIRLAKERAKLDVSKDVELLVYPQKPSIFDIFAHSFGGTSAARIAATSQLAGQWEQARAIRIDGSRAQPLPPRRSADADAECVCEMRDRFN